MPHDYEPSSRRYRFNGRYVPRAELRKEIDKLSRFIRREASSIGAKYASGEIGIAEFEIAMRELLRAGHIVSASVGKGGRDQMTLKDWGRVGRKVKWQYEYLAKFSRKLASGRLSKAFTESRARSYASSIYVSYAESRFVAAKEAIADGDGDRGRGRGGDADSRPRCRLIQNSEEGCIECTADADEGWMDVDDMTEIGGRICGDFCKCELLFEDEI